jgi:Uma2 family endonuclease
MISVAAYLENEKVADLKSEYVNGRRIPLVGASRLHDQLCMRLARLLQHQLAGSPYRLFRPTVKVHIQGAGDERFYYPDLQIGAAPGREYPDFLDAPRLILEVLSPTSAQRDREEKVPAYCRIAGLEELVLIAHDAPRIEVWRRAQAWVPQVVIGTDPLRLLSIAAEIPLDALYGGLALPGA